MGFRNLCKTRGKSWALTGLGGQSFNGTGNLFDPWVYHRTLFKPSENSWELTGHGWHSLGDMVDLWVHASNLLKSSKNSWELTGHGWHSPSDIGN